MAVTARYSLGDYLRLVKSGIVIGNSMHYMIGALIVVPLSWGGWTRVLIGLVGTALLIASACMVNNWLDRDYDKAMKRTAVRVTARGDITAGQLYGAAGILAVVGVILLWWLVNPLTAILGVIAWLSYSIVYTLSKPRTAWSTIIGTVPGALPAVAGYTAVTGQMTPTAWWLFALIVAWQLPHFYAIAVYRKSEYLAAKVSVLSTKVPARVMRRVIVVSLLGYVLVSVAAFWVEVDKLAAVAVVALAVAWFWQAWPYDEGKHETWARRLFGWSMYVSLGLLIAALLHFVLTGYM